MVVAVHVFDMQGRLMLVAENMTRVDVSTLPVGFYLLKIETEKGVSTQKIIKE